MSSQVAPLKRLITKETKLINKPLKEISIQDIEKLIKDQIPENRTIEYKSYLPNFTDIQERIRFLTSITSFANTIGGDLIYGIKTEEKGDTSLPKEIVGIEIANLDNLKGQLQDIIRTNIHPRLPGDFPEFSPRIQIDEHKCALVLRTPRSPLAPHMVQLVGEKEKCYFYGRDSGRKYPMDYYQIKRAFDLSASFGYLAKEFRNERLNKIRNGCDTPIYLKDVPVVVLHIIPMSSLETGKLYDIKELIKKANKIKPMSGTKYWEASPNYDGWFAVSKLENENNYTSYIQLFRNAVWEEVVTFLVKREYKLMNNSFEENIIKSCIEYLSFYEKSMVSPPLFIMISLLNVKDFKIHDYEVNGFDRNDLILPEIIIENTSQDLHESLRLAFEMIWQAGGHRSSPNYRYDEEKKKWMYLENY